MQDYIKVIILFTIATTTFALRCLDCNENNPNCRGLVVNYDTIGIEPCNTRCFVRKARDLGNKTIRGCDVRYWPQNGVTIPDNGCAVMNGEKWCWCDFDDLCNFFDDLTLSVMSGGYNTCNIKPCQNKGVCKSTSLNGDYQCDCSKTDFEGKNCEIPKQKKPVISLRKKN